MNEMNEMNEMLETRKVTNLLSLQLAHCLLIGAHECLTSHRVLIYKWQAMVRAWGLYFERVTGCHLGTTSRS